MVHQFIRRAGVLLAMTGVAVLGTVTAASADPGRADVAVQTVTVAQVSEDVAAPEAAALAINSTFDRILTAGLWNASGAGVAAMAAYCSSLVPGFLRPACVFIASSTVFAAFRRLGPPNGRCLNLVTRIAIPPYRLSYVACP